MMTICAQNAPNQIYPLWASFVSSVTNISVNRRLNFTMMSAYLGHLFTTDKETLLSIDALSCKCRLFITCIESTKSITRKISLNFFTELRN